MICIFIFPASSQIPNCDIVLHERQGQEVLTKEDVELHFAVLRWAGPGAATITALNLSGQLTCSASPFSDYLASNIGELSSET